MKKTLRIVALAMVAVILCLSLASCGKKISGTYSAEVFGTGVEYDFKGSKVAITVKALGAELGSAEGKYSIKDNQITFEFDRWSWRVVYTEKYMDTETVIEGRYTIPNVNSVPADFLSLSLDNERPYMVFDGDYVMIYQSNPALPNNKEKPEPIKMEATSFFGEGVGSIELFYEK